MKLMKYCLIVFIVFVAVLSVLFFIKRENMTVADYIVSQYAYDNGQTYYKPHFDFPPSECKSFQKRYGYEGSKCGRDCDCYPGLTCAYFRSQCSDLIPTSGRCVPKNLIKN